MLCCCYCFLYAQSASFFFLFSFHLSFCFAAQIQLSLCLTSLPFVASVSSDLRKSLISYSHLFFWSLYSSVRFDFAAESWIPCCCFSYPFVLLVAMLFTSPIATSFFCAFRSNMESWLYSCFLLPQLCFLLCTHSNLLVQVQLCQSLYLSLWQRRRRYLGRNRCLCCFLLVFRLRSSLGCLFSSMALFLIFRLLVISFFVFSSCLYDEPEHFALSRTYHSFVFFGEGPRSTRVAQCRRDHHIEQA